MSAPSSPELLTVIGGSGPVARPIVDELIELGFRVRLLARSADKVAQRYPAAEVVQGSMLDERAVARAMRGAATTLLITPIGPRNDAAYEIAAARPTIEAARRLETTSVIFVSTLAGGRRTGVALLDAKVEIEALLERSGVPWTALRCGTYMEDVIDSRTNWIDRGLFFFPVRRHLPFHFTEQRDVARAVRALVDRRRMLMAAVDLVDPTTYTPAGVARLMSEVCGRPIRATGRVPILWLLYLAWPYFHLRRHRMSTIIPLIRYFNRQGYRGDGQRLSQALPGWTATTLPDHLRALLGRERRPVNGDV